MRNKLLQANKKRAVKAKRLAVLAGTLSAATALTVGAAAPSPQLIARRSRRGKLSGKSSTRIDCMALQDVIEAYTAGTPPKEFPAELTSLLPGLETVGPQLLAALGSDQNTEFIRGLSLAGLLQCHSESQFQSRRPLPDPRSGGNRQQL